MNEKLHVPWREGQPTSKSFVLIRDAEGAIDWEANRSVHLAEGQRYMHFNDLCAFLHAAEAQEHRVKVLEDALEDISKLGSYDRVGGAWVASIAAKALDEARPEEPVRPIHSTDIEYKG